MDIKDILGEGYREDMTLEEVNMALADKELIDKSILSGYVPKDTADKYASEAADFKKKLRAKMTEDEAEKAKAAEEQEALKAELESLRKQNAVTDYEKRFLAIGYDPALAADTANALAGGDLKKVFDNQAKHIEAVRKDVKAEILKQTPTPPAAGGENMPSISRDQFDKMGYTERVKLKQESPGLYSELMEE